MPGLARVMSVDELLAVNDELVATIGPVEMEAYLRLIIPADNPLDRADLLGGMRPAMPAEAFAAVIDLAGEVLAPADFARLSVDLG